MNIHNYEIVEKLAESKETVIYKVYHRKQPEKLLLLKVFKTFLISNYTVSQFSQRIEHLKVLNNTLIITPAIFFINDQLCFIAQDFFEGVPLDNLSDARSEISLSDFFTIACQLAEALDVIHEAGIIHGGIKPHNILIDPNRLEIRLIDFLSAFDVRDVSHFIYDRSFVKNTLAYTSPEQTGRINHRVGFYSDLYSLGIVFYEMLTSRLPFSADDPLELIHSHLAEKAPDIHEINPNIPLVLSKIVSKLMLKAPEKRYQNSSGLLNDLMRCKEEYVATGSINEFPLESSVYTNRVSFISKMVGRDREAEVIIEEYEQAAGGAFRALFISGLSGIGKTRLIQELQKPIVKHRGYFTSGKFDVYQKNIPYSSLIQALRNLVRTFLTESEERVVLWSNRVLGVVGQNGKVLTDVIPELSILIGPQPEVQQLPPVESLNRFNDLIDRFLTCLASEENPLTLFIDDLQWCDAASFDFLSNIFANYKQHPYLFLLGAYRHNEVDASHPLTKLVKSIHEGNQPLKEIRLGPLEPQYCHDMVSYILDTKLDQTEALSGFINMLSEGNPLYVSESLSYLYHEDLLFIDENRHWRWDIDKIRQSDMPNSVVALFGSKIQKLPPELITLLEFCACMGNAFSPNDIALIKGMTLVETFEILKPALGQGLLMENKNWLQFIHDKVQEATLANITTQRRRQIHWQIGNHLLANIPEGTQEIEKLENLFAIVSHLNLGRESNLDSKTAYLLSDLNYRAGNKAIDSLATEAANEYFRLSRELLPADCWEEDQYEHTFKVFQKGAKTELMCGNYEDSERLLTEVLDHARSDLDKAECLAEQTTSLSSIGNFIKAIETANRGLSYFGKAIPDNREEAGNRWQEVMAEITEQKIDVWETILNMPFTNDRKSKVELAIYSELIPDLYMSGRVSQLYLAAAQSTKHCLSGGMDESVIYSFSIMGLQLGEQEEFERAFKYEDLARDLSAKYPNTFGATRGMNGIVWCNMHSRSHPREIVNYCLKSIQSGKNCGDLYNAGLSYGPLMWNLQVQGVNLTEIEDYAKECLQLSNRYNLTFSVGLAEAMQAGWIEPMKTGYAIIDMEEKLNTWERDNHIASAGSYCVNKALACYYCGDFIKADEYLVRVKRYLSGLTDNVLKRQWHVFLVLNALKLYEKGHRFINREELLLEIRPLIETIETWACLGPLLKPYLAFLYAELERVTGSFKEARSLYLDAINTAHELNYVFLEGHLNECLGELILSVGQCSERVFLTEAVRLYTKCGAIRKVNILTEKYPQYFVDSKPVYTLIEEDSVAYTLPNLDINYLMKSSLALAAEMEQDALLKKIMNVVIECSGAQHGYLLIEDEGRLFVRAESHIGDKQVQTVNQKLDDAPYICKAIARYVYRSRERVILDHACQEGMFKDNPEVQEMQLQSVLCLPVIKQSRRIGIMYLENRLANSVFTQEKTQMTDLLMSQAAISLENSRLVEDMKKAEDALRGAKEELEKRVLERTAELARANELLIRDNAKRKEAEETVKLERQRFNSIMEMLPVYLVLISPDYHVPFANRYFRERFGESPGLRCFEHLFGRSEPCEDCQSFRVLETMAPNEWDWTGPNGRNYDVFDFPFTDVDGSTLVLEMGIDVTERKKAEEEIQKLNRELELRVHERTGQLVKANKELVASEAQLQIALHEKETLLKEIHHRVKNNLQIIYSMLNLQMDHIKDEQAIEIFKESKDRVYSMALIHEKLYQSKSLATIDLHEYIPSLIDNLFLSYGANQRGIRLGLHIEKVTFSVDIIIPCALIINELVSNSLKHAFHDCSNCANTEKEILIDISQGIDNKIILTVSDNGVGLPKGFEMKNSESLGLKLVSVLVKQLKGSINYSTSGSAEFVITFEASK